MIKHRVTITRLDGDAEEVISFYETTGEVNIRDSGESVLITVTMARGLETVTT